MSKWMTGGLIVLFLLVTCFPIWPNILKLVLWYISCTALIAIVLTIFVRWFLFLFVWVFGYEFWVLPNLFDEERTVVDSFKPLYSFEPTSPGQLWWRIAVAGGFVAFIYWAYTQPTEVDAFMKSNRQFVDDLYEGNLLSDTSQLVRFGVSLLWIILKMRLNVIIFRISQHHKNNHCFRRGTILIIRIKSLQLKIYSVISNRKTINLRNLNVSKMFSSMKTSIKTKMWMRSLTLSLKTYLKKLIATFEKSENTFRRAVRHCFEPETTLNCFIF